MSRLYLLLFASSFIWAMNEESAGAVAHVQYGNGQNFVHQQTGRSVFISYDEKQLRGLMCQDGHQRVIAQIQNDLIGLKTTSEGVVKPFELAANESYGAIFKLSAYKEGLPLMAFGTGSCALLFQAVFAEAIYPDHQEYAVCGMLKMNFFGGDVAKLAISEFSKASIVDLTFMGQNYANDLPVVFEFEKKQGLLKSVYDMQRMLNLEKVIADAQVQMDVEQRKINSANALIAELTKVEAVRNSYTNLKDHAEAAKHDDYQIAELLGYSYILGVHIEQLNEELKNENLTSEQRAEIEQKIRIREKAKTDIDQRARDQKEERSKLVLDAACLNLSSEELNDIYAQQKALKAMVFPNSAVAMQAALATIGTNLENNATHLLKEGDNILHDGQHLAHHLVASAQHNAFLISITAGGAALVAHEKADEIFNMMKDNAEKFADFTSRHANALATSASIHANMAAITAQDLAESAAAHLRTVISIFDAHKNGQEIAQADHDALQKQAVDLQEKAGAHADDFHKLHQISAEQAASEARLATLRAATAEEEHRQTKIHHNLMTFRK